MRLDIDTFKEISDALVRNKRRSLLTAFGIFWGLFMLLFLAGGGDGFKAMMLKNFEGFANNTFIVASSTTTIPYKGMKEGRYWRLEYKDISRLRNTIPEIDIISPMISQWGLNAVYEDKTSSGSIMGVTPDYQYIETPSLKYGRFLNQTDENLSRKVCVIGKRIYNELFPEGGDPCGKMIQLGSVWFTVVGVNVSSSNMSINGSPDQHITIPYSVAKTIYKKGDKLDLIAATAKSGVKASSLEKRLRSVVARAHLFDPEDMQALMFMNTEQIFSLMDNLFRGIKFLIWLVGIGTLLAGAIGVSNIMMVTVKERTTEIGIRRAIGATPVEILSQIMLESVTLTLVAGCAGIVFTVLLLAGMDLGVGDAQGISFQIKFATAMFAVLLLAVLGVLAGLAPALRAMRIKPVEAMRDE